MSDLAPGQSARLNVTKESNHRIVAGLGWNPHKPGIIEKVQDMAGLGTPQHNLDLSCTLLSASGEILEIVDQRESHALNATGHVYHSGDNVDGFGAGDDEEISAELKNLPGHIASLVFVARNDSGQRFTDVDDAQIRLYDGYTGREFLSARLGAPEHTKENTFIFCRITRDAQGWILTNVHAYAHTATPESLSETIRTYL